MARRLPPLNGLRVFEAAARHLSFTQAALELNVTQAAVSHQIKALEDFLGVGLFRRLNRSLRLTEAGERYAPALREAFDAMELATQRLRPDDEAKGALTVSVTPTFLAGWLIPRMYRWQERQPEIELRITATGRVVDFAREDVDVAVRHGRGHWSGLKAVRLFCEDMVPVCSPTLRNGDPPLREPEDLARHVLLHDLTDPGAWETWLKAAGLAHIDPNRGPRFENGVFALQAAAQGLGVAIERRPLIKDDLANGRVTIPFAVNVPNQAAYHLVYPERAHAKAKVRLFHDWILDEVAEMKRDGA